MGQLLRQYVLRVGDRGTSGTIELAPAFENELQLLADKVLRERGPTCYATYY